MISEPTADLAFHLPNLPGVRRGPLEAAPVRFSKSRPRPLNSRSQKEELPPLDAAQLISNFDDLSKATSSFPSTASK